MTAQMRRQWLATRVWDLGPRVFFEFVSELEKYGVADLDRRLEQYSKLDPRLLRAVGADKFAAAPIHLAGGRPR